MMTAQHPKKSWCCYTMAVNTTQIEEVSVESSEIYTSFHISVDSEITFGPIYNAEEDADVTLIANGPPDPQNVITMTVHDTDRVKRL